MECELNLFLVTLAALMLILLVSRFRWADCQLEELKRLKSTRPSHVEAALCDLPDTLDKTYERILTGNEKRSRKDALVLLRWLTFASSPLSLGELAEVRIIDLEGDGRVTPIPA